MSFGKITWDDRLFIWKPSDKIYIDDDGLLANIVFSEIPTKEILLSNHTITGEIFHKIEQRLESLEQEIKKYK